MPRRHPAANHLLVIAWSCVWSCTCVEQPGHDTDVLTSNAHCSGALGLQTFASVDAGDVARILEACVPHRADRGEGLQSESAAAVRVAREHVGVVSRLLDARAKTRRNSKAITNKWLAAGCRRGICPAIACVNPGIGVCSESGGSGGRCVDSTVLR